MSAVRTEYEFVLPRGYLDESGALHKRGTMRLATARDELQPLRDPTVQGPDDPRLTILVLARVVESLGTLTLVTPYEIEGLFAADLAYLQDFYGVINFGTPEEIDALLQAQDEEAARAMAASRNEAQAAPVAAPAGPAAEPAPAPEPAPAQAAAAPATPDEQPPTDVRSGGRRAAIEEVSSTNR